MIGDSLIDGLSGALGSAFGNSSTLPPPRAKVSRGGGASASAGFGASLLALVAGPAQPDALTTALVAAEVKLLPAPALASCRLRFLPQTDFPSLAIGDLLTLELGAGAELIPVFSGPLALIGSRRGVLELVLASSATPLARIRRNAGYENQSFADLIKMWAGETSITPGDLDTGPTYAFVSIDAQASLWEWMARLGAAADVQVWMDADGKLNARAARGQPMTSWSWGQDLLALEVALPDPAISPFATLPSGKAREGSWSAAKKSTATATPEATGTAPGLASRPGGGKVSGRVSISVPGCAAIDLASLFALRNCPQGHGDGNWMAIAVEHRFTAAAGFTTHVTGVPA